MAAMRDASSPDITTSTSPVDAYAKAGVDYDRLDAAKRLAGELAAGTAAQLTAHGAAELPSSRGQSAFVFQIGGLTLATVLECLGTKSGLARDYARLTGEDHWDAVARDTVAAIVNDLASVGARPLVVNAYFATGSAGFLDDPAAFGSLARGWQAACQDAGATWGGGETPTLPGVIAPDALDLAGSAVGLVPAGHAPLLGDDLAAGDEIVLVASSGLHANGASLARRVCQELPDGLLHELPSGRRIGEALLDPSVIYVGLVRALQDARVPVTYVSHITGHGLRKVMRADRDLRYVVETLPEVPEVLAALGELGGLSAEDAYGTLNMGAGLAVMARPGGGRQVVETAARLGHPAVLAGHVEAGDRSVVLAPVGVRFAGESLQLG
jgi:phosphoribosylformylglycinamidine cyclo-ligase